MDRQYIFENSTFFINYNFFFFFKILIIKKAFSIISSLFKRRPMENVETDFSKINIEDQPQTLEKPQQSFSFEADTFSKSNQVAIKLNLNYEI